jgi:uncharacterized protein (TIGR02145 family)
MRNLQVVLLIIFLFICCIKNPNELIVTLPVNKPPTASFTISQSFCDTLTVLQFDASSSNDNDDSFSKLRFSWDWENDGTWDIINPTNHKPTHQFGSLGNYIVKLSVTDSEGLLDDTTQTVKVLEGTGTVTDVDGNIYLTVIIGDQWWMAENLKVTHYRNGNVIPCVSDSANWSNLKNSGAYCNYHNNSKLATTYGRLYNWYAANGSRDIAPQGWHVATDADWKELEMYLGMGQFDADTSGWRGTREGGKLKEAGTEHWRSPNKGATNEYGFSALPSGVRVVDGSYNGIGFSVFFWSSTELDRNHVFIRSLQEDESTIYRYEGLKYHGFSIRCVKN